MKEGSMKDSASSIINFLVDQLDSFDDETITQKDKDSINKIFTILGRTPKLAVLDTIVKEYKTYYNNITRNDLPLALAEAGLSKAVTDNGIEVSTKTEYTTKTLDKDLMIYWLDKEGYGDIVKDALMLEKGQYNEKVEAALKKLGVSYSRDSAVNGQQLKSVIKRHMDEGKDAPPKAAVAVEVFVEAKIKRPAKKDKDLF
jgi:DNA-binding transcriptional ArsR family regulator